MKVLEVDLQLYYECFIECNKTKRDLQKINYIKIWQNTFKMIECKAIKLDDAIDRINLNTPSWTVKLTEIIRFADDMILVGGSENNLHYNLEI